ncbi:unnamed protein product [Dicrocoelium dendriticum]|nr:unnamed protein product [Dicrocoelium dendriticum]
MPPAIQKLNEWATSGIEIQDHARCYLQKFNTIGDDDEPGGLSRTLVHVQNDSDIKRKRVKGKRCWGSLRLSNCEFPFQQHMETTRFPLPTQTQREKEKLEKACKGIKPCYFQEWPINGIKRYAALINIIRQTDRNMFLSIKMDRRFTRLPTIQE